MKTKQLPALLYLAFQRSADSQTDRTIEGYAYVNERCNNEQIVWLRSAIENATPAYLKWGNVREMHQPKAVGKVTAAEWDEKGVYIRAHIVDDDCWSKIEAGVYSGFSMRISPLKMRGNCIVQCRIAEISVVDQPKDEDCPFSIARGEGLEVDVDVDTDSTRGVFAEKIKACEKSQLRYLTTNLLSEILYDIQYSQETNKEELIREAFTEAANYIAPVLARGELEIADPSPMIRIGSQLASMETVPSDPTVLERAEYNRLNDTISALTQERDLARAQLGEEKARVEALETRLKELEKTPATKDSPVRMAVMRSIVQIAEEKTQERETLVNELKELLRSTDSKTEEEMLTKATRISQLKAQLQVLGYDPNNALI